MHVPHSVPEERKPKKERSILKVLSPIFLSLILSTMSIAISDGKKTGTKRKASPSPDEPAKKKNKPTPKVTKGRMKGPVDLDKQCGVINDKGLPCSRSLTCKSHSMGAKRSVLGRSKKYDELLLEWQRANNPNFVEPVKRVSKAEKKEKRDKERMEKKDWPRKQPQPWALTLPLSRKLVRHLSPRNQAKRLRLQMQLCALQISFETIIQKISMIWTRKLKSTS
jgi:hypothetical protein